MNDLLPPNDPIDAMGEAYELLLENLFQNAHKSGAFFHQMIEKSRDDIVALNKFSEDEIVKLAGFLKRDLFDAARYLDKTENAVNIKYYSGEITGLGTLECDQCGENVHFQKPGKIPICAKCNGTVFHRQKF